MHNKTILRFNQVCNLTGLARSTIYTRLDPDSPQYDPEFPKPAKLGPRLTVWNSAEIDVWIDKVLGQGGQKQ